MSEAETWREILGYEGLYQVSNMGRVCSMLHVTKNGSSPRSKPLIRKLQTLRNGYKCLILSDFCGKKKLLLVHRLVLIAFRGLPGAGMESAHLNNDRKDNRLENLIWATRKENHSHKIIHGTTQRGERCGASKLTQDQVRAIKGEIVPGCRENGIRPIARRYGVSQWCIQSIFRGLTWSKENTEPVL